MVLGVAAFLLAPVGAATAAARAASDDAHPAVEAAPAARRADAPRPNVIFILADDLGYGDLGLLYQNDRHADGRPAFATPNLDRLGRSGIIFRQHYTGAPVCAPARASLLTGQSQGHCPIRDNQFDKVLPENLLTLGSVLRTAGYRTMVVGKWGLGGTEGSGWPAHPMRRGFDDFFGFMRHGWGHVYYHDAKHPLMDGLADVGNKYEGVYSTDLFTARAKKFITDQHARKPDQPFFLYLAYTAVHAAVQVPSGPMPPGAGLSGGLHWPVPPADAAARDKWIHPDYARQPWTEPMKRYATLVRRLDDGVGDLLQLLNDLGIERDTLVIFSSDNGPSNEGGADPRMFDSWGPFDGFKRDIFEGGVREPTLASWPGHVPANKIDDSLTAFWDWMPTLAELAGVAPPAQSDGISLVPNLLGRPRPNTHPYIYIEYDFSGKMHNPASKDVFARKGVTGRGQQQLVRIGDLVGVRTQIRKADDPLRIYDVRSDPHEDHNLAGDPQFKTIGDRMRELLVSARRPDPSAPRPYDAVPMPATAAPQGAVTDGHLLRSRFDGEWPWTADFRCLTPTKTSDCDGLDLRDAAGTAPSARGLLFTGYLRVPADGEYTFKAELRQGAAAHGWLHDAHLIAAEELAHPQSVEARVALRAGLHPFRLAYRQQSGVKTGIVLRYSGPGLAEQAVPASAFARPREAAGTTSKPGRP
jgi:arylsulfatase A-like enzyme